MDLLRALSKNEFTISYSNHLKKPLILILLFLLGIGNIIANELFDAVIAGDVAKVKFQLKSGDSPNYFNMMYLTKKKTGRGDIKKFERQTVKTNNQMSIKFNDHFIPTQHTFSNPLFAAIGTKNYKIAAMLIEKGAYVNTEQNFHMQNVLAKRDQYYFTVAGLYYNYKGNDFYNFIFYDTPVTVSFTPLSLLIAHKYACQGNILIDSLIEKLITKGASPAYPTYIRMYQSGYTSSELIVPFNLLAIAIIHKDLKTVKLLVEKGSHVNPYLNKQMRSKKKRVNIPIYSFWSLLEMSEKHSTSEITAYLKEKGAVKLPAKHNPKIYYSGMSKKIICSTNEDENISVEDVLCWNINLSTKSNHINQCVKLYHKHGGNPNRYDLLTSLVQNKKYGTAAYLIKQGAIIRPKLMCHIMNSGQQKLIETALKSNKNFHFISFYKHRNIGYGADRNQTYTSPFLEALLSGNIEVANWMLETNADLSVNPNYLPSCLSYAAASKNKEIVSKILTMCSRSIINESFTPIGRYDFVVYHKDYKNHFRSLSSIYKLYSPFYASLKYSTPEIINLFIEKGADLTKNLSYIGGMKAKGKFNYKKNKYKRFSKKERNVYLKIKNRKTFYSPFLYYCATVKKTDINIIKLLVENGADINHKSTIWNQTGIYFVDDIESIKYLCEKGVDLNVYNLRETQQPTVIWKFVSFGGIAKKDAIPIISILLQNGASTKIGSNSMFSNHKKETLLKFAKRIKHKELIALLKDNR